jgi:hypothetical protein
MTELTVNRKHQTALILAKPKSLRRVVPQAVL